MFSKPNIVFPFFHSVIHEIIYLILTDIIVTMITIRCINYYIRLFSNYKIFLVYFF